MILNLFQISGALFHFDQTDQAHSHCLFALKLALMEHLFVKTNLKQPSKTFIQARLQLS